MLDIAFEGTVERGEGLASRLGCPTANISLEQGGLIPGLGVYVGGARVLDHNYPTIVFISGSRGGQLLKLEVHFIDQNLELTGKHVRVRLFEKIRDIIDWPGDQVMADMLTQDVRQARAWFQTHALPIEI
ncbi:riboflavin kinase [Candidatus Uhrbacteria bacterium]|nr:riboflavin kinase [Candidatus Uhrbacteria bacterium]